MDKEAVVYIHTMVCHLATKNNNMAFADKWMELENNMLSEISQSQKTKGQTIFPDKWMVIYNGGEGSRGERRMEEL